MPNIIHAYTRQDAIDDGILIDVTVQYERLGVNRIPKPYNVCASPAAYDEKSIENTITKALRSIPENIDSMSFIYFQPYRYGDKDFTFIWSYEPMSVEELNKNTGHYCLTIMLVDED